MRQFSELKASAPWVCSRSSMVWPVLLAHTASGEAPSWIAKMLVEGVAIAIVAATLYLAVRYLVCPGERDGEHIKRQVLDQEDS